MWTGAPKGAGRAIRAAGARDRVPGGGNLTNPLHHNTPRMSRGSPLRSRAVTEQPRSAIPPADSLEWCATEPPSVDLAHCDSSMESRGLRRARTLVELRRSLPLGGSATAWIPEVTTRAFDPQRDATSLLTVNNAAFHWHPEQGGWDLERLASALAQHWVDPAGILVHDSPHPSGPDDLIDGFCWTRVHPADEPEVLAAGDPALGEIWVIATHPRVHGTRLGPAMVAAGLEHLAGRGLLTANLFTEADNHVALAMYDRLGFSVHQMRGGYR